MWDEGSGGQRGERDKQRWLKRQALQVSAMLPEDPAEAEQVLRLALQLNETFMHEPEPARLDLVVDNDR